jgi:hypothetical protein
MVESAAPWGRINDYGFQSQKFEFAVQAACVVKPKQAEPTVGIQRLVLYGCVVHLQAVAPLIVGNAHVSWVVNELQLP